MIESSIICEYLEDRYPQPALRPDDAHEVARMRFWMKQIDNKPANTNVSAVPWTTSAVSANSNFSRNPAINTNASVNPTPPLSSSSHK